MATESEPSQVTWSCNQDDTSPQKLMLQVTLPKVCVQLEYCNYYMFLKYLLAC